MNFIIIAVIIILIFVQLKKKNSNFKPKNINYGDTKVYKNCVSCHYLTKKIDDKYIILNAVERQKILDGNYEFITNSNIDWEFCCFKQEWVKKAKLEEESELNKLLVEKNRKNKCYFIEFKNGIRLEDIEKK